MSEPVGSALGRDRGCGPAGLALAATLGKTEIPVDWWSASSRRH
jgi:hypothetical protein